MKLKMQTWIVTAAVLGVAVGCARQEPFVLEADPAQIGAGAQIRMTGDAGHLIAGVMPGHPNGVSLGVTEVDRIQSPTGSSWTVRLDNKVELSFIVVGKSYICQDCSSYNLPLNWHSLPK